MKNFFVDGSAAFGGIKSFSGAAVLPSAGKKFKPRKAESLEKILNWVD